MLKPQNGKPIRMGIIGLGHWGPNLVRVLSTTPDCEITAFCDVNRDRLEDFCQRFPLAYGTTDVDDLLDPELIDAVVIAAPTHMHYSLASAALSRGIHAFVEKPLATTSAECEHLIELAAAHSLILFVGHIFLYSAPVDKLQEMVGNNEFGDLYYMSSTRLNLGPVRQDVNALWDLAPHDISIMLDLMGTTPVSVSCSGLAYLNDEIHDVCTLNMQFDNNRMGIVHVSWLDPHKKREMTVVGSKKMAIYNDLEPLEKIKVYDNGVEAAPPSESFGEFQFSYRYGDMFCPRLNEVEPLKAEVASFVDCVMHGYQPKTDGQNGLAVVSVLEAADMSLREKQGAAVDLADFPKPLSQPGSNGNSVGNH